MIDDLEISDEEKIYYKNLLKSNKQLNLEERFRLFQGILPVYSEKRFGFLPQIIKKEWAVLAFNGDEFSYSSGLYYRYDQPDIMLFSDKRGIKERAHIINTISIYIKNGNKLKLDYDYAPIIFNESIFEIESLNFRNYTPKDFETMPCGLLYSFNQYFKDELFEDELPLLIAEIKDPEGFQDIESRINAIAEDSS